MEQAGIYRLHRLWEGLQKQRGDRWTCFFSPAVTKMQRGFRALRTTGRKGKQKVLILVSASHPCCSLIALRLGHSPGTHLQQSTRLINTDKFSVNTHDTDIEPPGPFLNFSFEDWWNPLCPWFRTRIWTGIYRDQYCIVCRSAFSPSTQVSQRAVYLHLSGRTIPLCTKYLNTGSNQLLLTSCLGQSATWRKSEF